MESSAILDQLVLTVFVHQLVLLVLKHCALPLPSCFITVDLPANEKGLSFFEAEISFSVVFSDHLLWVFLLGHLFLKSSVSHYSLGSE